MSDLPLIIGEIEAKKTKLCIACTEKGIPGVATLIESYTQNIVDIITVHLNDDKLDKARCSMGKLKSCPYCGSKGLWIVHSNTDWFYKWGYECKRCHFHSQMMPTKYLARLIWNPQKAKSEVSV